MIRLTRIRSETVVDANFRGDKKKQFEEELMINQRRILLGELEKHAWVTSRWKKAKTQLLAETKGKCAYCEAPTSLVTYGDVEHYRPKSKYWWLAYCYDNYLVSCTVCNSKFKGNKFPILNAKMRGPTIRTNTTDSFIKSKAGKLSPEPIELAQVEKFLDGHNQERPLLINPYFDFPEQFFAWKPDDALREVELIPLPANMEAKEYCDSAIKYFGLNRIELKRLRYYIYFLFRPLKRAFSDSSISQQTKDETEQAIIEMKSQEAPFAGMIRYFDSLPSLP